MKLFIYTFIYSVFIFQQILSEDFPTLNESLKKVNYIDELYLYKTTYRLASISDTIDMKKMQVESIQVNAQYIAVLFNDGNVHIWTTKGFYIGQAGRKGKGPGEYISILTFYFNNNDYFYIVDSARTIINMYEIKKNSIKFFDSFDISVVAPVSPSNVIPDNSGNYIFVYEGLPKNFNRLIFVDKDFKIRKKCWTQTANDAFCTNEMLIRNRNIILPDVKNIDGNALSNNLFVYSLDNYNSTVVKITHDDIFLLRQDVLCKILFYTRRSEKDAVYILSYDGKLFGKCKYRDFTKVDSRFKGYNVYSGLSANHEKNSIVWIATKENEKALFLFYYDYKIPER